MAAKPEVIAAQAKLAKEFVTIPNLLGGIAKQRAYVAALHMMTPPCWSCGEPVSYLEAVGEDYDPEVYRGDAEKYECPHCKVAMIYAVPFIAAPAPWFWGNPKIYGKKEEKK